MGSEPVNRRWNALLCARPRLHHLACVCTHKLLLATHRDALSNALSRSYYMQVSYGQMLCFDIRFKLDRKWVLRGSVRHWFFGHLGRTDDFQQRWPVLIVVDRPRHQWLPGQKESEKTLHNCGPLSFLIDLRHIHALALSAVPRMRRPTHGCSRVSRTEPRLIPHQPNHGISRVIPHGISRGAFRIAHAFFIRPSAAYPASSSSSYKADNK